MSAQPEHIGSGDIPHPTIGDIDDLATWCLLSCTNTSLQCAAGEIIVLRVAGEVDLYTVPILHAALDKVLGQDPAHLVVDLAQMTFCSVRGLDLLTQTRRIAAAKATGYAVTGVLPRINHVWTLSWGGELPIHYRSTTAAVTAIRAAEPDMQVYQPRQAVGDTSRLEGFQLGPNVFPTDAPSLLPRNRYGFSPGLHPRPPA